MVGFIERRHHPRATFNGITLIRSGEREIPCVAGNLSETGILLYPQVPTTPGSAFQVTFTLPSAYGWIDLEGSIVRSHRTHRCVEWGVQFNHVPQPVQDLLRSYVRRRPLAISTRCEEIPLPPPAPLHDMPHTVRPSSDNYDEAQTQVQSERAPGSEGCTVATLRDAILSSDGPTRLTNTREASTLRDRCRKN